MRRCVRGLHDVRAPAVAGGARAGFTLIELLVVLAIMALLASLTLPRYFRSIDVAREKVLAENLRITRGAIDQFFGDTGRYPESLAELVERHYLRGLPFDPETNSADSWSLVAPEEPFKGGVADLHSGAAGAAQDGRPFADF